MSIQFDSAKQLKWISCPSWKREQGVGVALCDSFSFFVKE